MPSENPAAGCSTHLPDAKPSGIATQTGRSLAGGGGDASAAGLACARQAVTTAPDSAEPQLQALGFGNQF